MAKIVLLTSTVSDMAIDSSLTASLLYVGNDKKKALKIAEDLVDFLTTNAGWDVILECDNFCTLKNGHWYKTVEIKFNV